MVKIHFHRKPLDWDFWTKQTDKKIIKIIEPKSIAKEEDDFIVRVDETGIDEEKVYE